MAARNCSRILSLLAGKLLAAAARKCSKNTVTSRISSQHLTGNGSSWAAAFHRFPMFWNISTCIGSNIRLHLPIMPGAFTVCEPMYGTLLLMNDLWKGSCPSSCISEKECSNSIVSGDVSVAEHSIFMRYTACPFNSRWVFHGSLCRRCHV